MFQMIEMPKMLMIGAAGANVGKTRFACDIISRFANKHDIIAVKVTTITTHNGPCPRGGEGCGVCSSLEGNFDITQERSTNSQKDTARLLAAGAKKVYWLRAMKNCLEDAALVLLETIGPKALCVCESNSLRLAVKPGLFIIIKDKKKNGYKPSADDVVVFADKTVTFDNDNFDISAEAFTLINNQWGIRAI